MLADKLRGYDSPAAVPISTSGHVFSEMDRLDASYSRLHDMFAKLREAIGPVMGQPMTKVCQEKSCSPPQQDYGCEVGNRIHQVCDQFVDLADGVEEILHRILL